MQQPFPETNEQPAPRKVGQASAYSAHIQEAMRYDKLPSADYSLVMTLLHAVLHGYTEEKWQEEQQRTIAALTKQATDKKAAHADAANRYEQTTAKLKDLALWPW